MNHQHALFFHSTKKRLGQPRGHRGADGRARAAGRGAHGQERRAVRIGLAWLGLYDVDGTMGQSNDGGDWSARSNIYIYTHAFALPYQSIQANNNHHHRTQTKNSATQLATELNKIRKSSSGHAPNAGQADDAAAAAAGVGGVGADAKV